MLQPSSRSAFIAMGTLSYQVLAHFHNFGDMLEPRWIVGTGRLDE